MSATTGSANYRAAVALAGGLAASGIRHAVVCPGSRSTPIAVALLHEPGIRLWVQIDERSAAFFALGMARELGEPVALLGTSGTAAANFLPAVAEAFLGRIPLVVLTADRPPELRGWGAAQTIDQIALFGSHVKWFADMPVPDGEPAVARQFRSSAARAARTALATPSGPVHLNLPFREPLLPDALPEQAAESISTGSAVESISAMQPSHLVPDAATVGQLAEQMANSPRGLIVCGPSASPDLPAAAIALAHVSGYPILADPLSGLRFGAGAREGIITAYDPFLRVHPDPAALAPDVVIRTGAIPTSKPLLQFLAAHPGETHALIDPGPPRDPDRLATIVMHADEAMTLRAIAGALEGREHDWSRAWRNLWRDLDCRASRAIADALVTTEEPFEGRAIAVLADLLPDRATLVAGNSMPIRDVDAFVRGDGRRVRIVSNRGANGIDGVVSSALGAAAVVTGPLALVLGDLSFYHDLNGLLAAGRFGIAATIVVLNNDGGGIFSFLPQAGLLDEATFETLFGTPAGIDVEAAARLYGASYARPRDWPAFRCAVERSLRNPGLDIIEVVTDRARNVELHQRAWQAVAAAIAPGDHR
ncbi:MAG: 2-succinyl-5-enolpyruvyl-6-hydroxy-3-cyclohexene-1-carboxylic-acid synthase [Thermomicrobiales bacterium]|nr:2-succinyl-5-enolpyruvyl-6-hydroxy-3-cyclohexene-1-carboxylic-acid synthase [Thermomicrobiales bacterium]